MSLRWRTLLCVQVCGAVVGALFAPAADAQCHHSGQFAQPNSRMLQTLVRQQLLQQKRTLLHVQQVRILQAKVLENQIRELAGKGPEAIEAALRDPKAEMRWVAALVVGERGPFRPNQLIKLLSDANPYVRQAARQGLVRLSTRVSTREDKLRSPRSVDFGPAPNARPSAQKAAARKWTAWFEKQKKQPSKQKTTIARQTPAAVGKRGRQVTGEKIEAARSRDR